MIQDWLNKLQSIQLQILQSLRVDICSACGLFKENLTSVLENKTKLSSLFKIWLPLQIHKIFAQVSIEKLLNHHSVNLASLFIQWSWIKIHQKMHSRRLGKELCYSLYNVHVLSTDNNSLSHIAVFF